MIHQKLIPLTYLLSLVSLGLHEPSQARDDSRAVKMEITNLSESVGAAPKSSNAILTVWFTYSERTAKSVVFHAQAHGQFSRMDLNKGVQITALNVRDGLNAGDCATLSYSWSNLSGTNAMTGVADLCNDDMKLPPLGIARPFYVPVKAPITSGTYKLHAVFDNRNLAAIMATHSDTDEPNLYFEATADKTFTIKSRSKSTFRD